MEEAFFMQEAIKEAQLAFEHNEVPIGAVLVHDQKIIARAFNRVEEQKSVLMHAEMQCLKEGAAFLNNWRLVDTVLYTTLEPCPMCAGALLLSRVSKVIWAADDPRQGAGGSFCRLLLDPYPFCQVAVQKGLFAQESATLLQTFFRKRRG